MLGDEFEHFQSLGSFKKASFVLGSELWEHKYHSMLDRVIYKWKNHFYEMKGDVGMSVHEKERKQEDAYTKTQTHS